MTRLDWTLTGLVVLATLTVIFMVGVSAFAGGLVFWLKEAPGASSESPEARQSLPQNLPQSDAPGRDMPGVERYPESVRVKYERYDLGESEIVEVGYLTDSGPEDVIDFYEGMTWSEGWRAAGSDGGPDDELGILMTKNEEEGKRRVLVEIESQGKLVSVELEETVAGGV